MPHSHILSNSLIGGGSMNPDKLSLNLPFSTSKSLAASLGPTPTFTRGSKGTHSALGVLIGAEILIPTGTSNGRNSWSIADGSINHTLSYDGNRWVAGIDQGDFSQVFYYASNGSQWRPNQANWSGSGIPSEYVPVDAINDPILVINAEINEPRFDHNSVTYSCKGLLNEESRQNRTRYSYNNFTNAYWESTASNTTAVDGVDISPDGLVSGCSSLTEIAGVSVSRHIHEFAGEFIPIANTAYTMSIWVKQSPTNPVRYVQLAFWISGFGSTAYMNFDIQSGVVGTGGAGITASSITAYPNGWYRITATATSVASPTASGFQLGFSTTSGAVRTEAYTVVSPLKSIYLWGAQVEAGSFVTSYIPTTTSSLARSTDVLSITGSNFSKIYNSSANSSVIKVTGMGFTGGPNQLFSLNQTSAPFTNRAYVGAYNSVNNTEVTVVSGGTGYMSYVGGVTNKSGRFALAYSLNDGAYVHDGTVEKTATSLVPPVSVDRLVFEPCNGCISSFKNYKKRLSNAKLQLLTA